MNVFDNIVFFFKVVGVVKLEIVDRVVEVVDLMKLGLYFKCNLYELFGGQQQCIVFVCVIVKESDVVFLDELLVNFDYKLCEEFWDQFFELFVGCGVVVVYVILEFEEVLLLGGWIVFMLDGYVVQFGLMVEIYWKLKDLVVVKVFLNLLINIVEIIKQGDIVILSDMIWWMVMGVVVLFQDGFYILVIWLYYVLFVQIVIYLVSFEGYVQVIELSGLESSVYFDMYGQFWVFLFYGVYFYFVGEVCIFYLDLSYCFFFVLSGELVVQGRILWYILFFLICVIVICLICWQIVIMC